MKHYQPSMYSKTKLKTSLKNELNQFNVNNAFLNGYLQDNVFMTQPEGFVDQEKPQHVSLSMSAS